jgi:hypothetical protein
MVGSVRWEDMDIEYMDKQNIYSFMGVGRHLCQTQYGREMGVELSPYCDMSLIDKRMLD